MTVYRDEREALLQRVELLEKTLAEQRGERDTAVHERQRMAEELALVRRELRRFQNRAIVPPPRWLGVGVAFAVAGMTGAVLQMRAFDPDASVLVVPGKPKAPEAPSAVTLTPVAPEEPEDADVDHLPPVIRPEGPAQPSRADVQQALRAAEIRARACPGRSHAELPVRVVFSGATGHVRAAQLTGSPEIPAETAACLLGEIRAASVPPFTNPGLTVTYPFRL